MILDRGATHGVDAGQAVVDATGVIGQVSRVYPIQSEVTLLTDKDQAIPVTVARNGFAEPSSARAAGSSSCAFCRPMQTSSRATSC